jgi:large subunit ribosomal protein L21
MYAVIETGGKQYRVEVGTELAVELLEVEPGQEITLERVLLVADGEEAAIGRPVVDGATVSATVLRNDRADKVISFKYKPKARRRVKKGHRQEQTILRITDVVLNGKSAAAEAEQAAEARKTERQRLEEAAATQAAADAALAATLAERAAEAAPAGDEATPTAPPRARARAPKASQAKTAGPKTSAPKAAGPKAGGPKTSAPKAAPDAKAPAAETPAKPKRTRAAKKED